jgi:hypothetical protein
MNSQHSSLQAHRDAAHKKKNSKKPLNIMITPLSPAAINES